MIPPNALSHDFPQGPEVLLPFESLYDRYHVRVYRLSIARFHDIREDMLKLVRPVSL